MSDKNTLAEALEKYNKVFGTYSHDYVKELEKQLDNAMCLLMNHEQHKEPSWLKNYEELIREYER
jgi:hypothetical protein